MLAGSSNNLQCASCLEVVIPHGPILYAFLSYISLRDGRVCDETKFIRLNHSCMYAFPVHLDTCKNQQRQIALPTADVHDQHAAQGTSRPRLLRRPHWSAKTLIYLFRRKPGIHKTTWLRTRTCGMHLDHVCFPDVKKAKMEFRERWDRRKSNTLKLRKSSQEA